MMGSKYKVLNTFISMDGHAINNNETITVVAIDFSSGAFNVIKQDCNGIAYWVHAMNILGMCAPLSTERVEKCESSLFQSQISPAIKDWISTLKLKD